MPTSTTVRLIPLLYKYGYEGPVYSTPPTRDLSAMLQLDYLDVIHKEDRKVPYSSNEVKTYIRHSITLNYGSVTDIAPDIKLTFHNAGHILGSAIAHFHIGDGMYNIAFTGDFNYSKSRLFNPAVNQFPRLEALFMESTYGGSNDFQQPTGRSRGKTLRDDQYRPPAGRKGHNPRVLRRAFAGSHACPRRRDAS